MVRNLCFLSLLLVLFSSNVWAQFSVEFEQDTAVFSEKVTEDSDSYALSYRSKLIGVNRSHGGYTFSQNREIITSHQVLKIMEDDSVAYNIMAVAYGARPIAKTGLIASLVLVGWNIGKFVVIKHETSLSPYFLVGASGVIVFSIAGRKINKQMADAVDIYNRGVREKNTSKDFKINISTNALTLNYTF